MRSRAILLLTMMVAALIVASGVALAATISCPNRSGSLCVGTSQGDTMTGGDRADDMRGREGADLMRGGGGADVMVGQEGADSVFGQDGPDTLSGGPGKDTLSGAKGKDRLTAAEGDDALGGGRADDIYAFNSNNWGDDTITDTTTADDDPINGNFAEFGFPEPLTTSVTVNLTSSANSPEVSNGTLTGTVNWSNNAIDGVYVDATTGATITGNGLANQLTAKSNAKDTVSGGAGNDWISVLNFNSVVDVVDCGEDPGNTDVDRVFVDNGVDTFVGCEVANDVPTGQ